MGQSGADYRENLSVSASVCDDEEVDSYKENQFLQQDRNNLFGFWEKLLSVFMIWIVSAGILFIFFDGSIFDVRIDNFRFLFAISMNSFFLVSLYDHYLCIKKYKKQSNIRDFDQVKGRYFLKSKQLFHVVPIYDMLVAEKAQSALGRRAKYLFSCGMMMLGFALFLQLFGFFYSPFSNNLKDWFIGHYLSLVRLLGCASMNYGTSDSILVSSNAGIYYLFLKSIGVIALLFFSKKIFLFCSILFFKEALIFHDKRLIRRYTLIYEFMQMNGLCDMSIDRFILWSQGGKISRLFMLFAVAIGRLFNRINGYFLLVSDNVKNVLGKSNEKLMM